MKNDSHKTKQHTTVGIILRGMAMGAADVVPGVSGGTMALITGIYERLIAAVGAITDGGLAAFRKEGMNPRGVKAAWKAIDGNFLLALGVGVLTSVVTVAQVVSWALDAYPPVVWAFFFGLIVASAAYVGKGIRQWRYRHAAMVLFFAAALVLISAATPVTTPETWWFLLLSGMIAISAMILPGISGSFLLVLLGKYEYVLDAVHELHLADLAIFALGCGIGILTSARIISWLFAKYHDSTMASILGIMIGSLYAVWPWRQITSYIGDPNSDDFKALTDKPVSPATYEAGSIQGIDPGLAANNAYLAAAIIAAIFGVALVVLITRFAANKQ